MRAVLATVAFMLGLTGLEPGIAWAQECNGLPDGAPCATLPGRCEGGECITPAEVTRVRVRAARRGDDGSITVKGTFDTYPPGDAFAALTGITVRVRDTLILDRTVTWATKECRTFPRGGIRCTAAHAARKARFKEMSDLSNVWRFTLRMKQFDNQLPFQAPVTVSVSHHAGVIRADSIATCSASLLNGALDCREAPTR